MSFSKVLIVPLLITAVFFIFQTFPLFTKFSIFSVIEEGKVDFQNPEKLDERIINNEKFTGTFKATDNNLGIILMRIIFFSGGPTDVTFKIKEKGDKNWHSENKYPGLQFWNKEYFPFGFSPFSSSKNNLYDYEIESTSSKGPNGIGISSEYPQTALVYKYSTGQLKDPKKLLSFLFKKFIYVLKNVNYFLLIEIFVISTLLALFLKMRFSYLSFEKKIVTYSMKINRKFFSNKFYSPLLNTNMKKRLVIGLLIFLLAFMYRFSFILVNQSHPWVGTYRTTFFYAGLGGQGDYDQFIRTATCAVTNFCSAILGQNFLLEASVLGTFYKIFGFTQALKVYLYLMLILSSLVATLPYFILSRKNWISLGGILGGLFLATSDFLTHISLNFPPDNGSLFTFSMFFIVYFLTLQKGTIRWLLFFGLMGTIDGLNKALFLINDLAVFLLFIPVFFYEKTKEASGSLFRRKNIKILVLSSIPLLVFLVIYIGWEYFVYYKFSAYYFLRGLIQSKAVSYVSYTSFNDTSSTGNILLGLMYLSTQAVIMVKRLIEYSDLQTIFLAPIFLGLLSFPFIKVPQKELVKKFILLSILSVFLITLMKLAANNYFKIHEIFNGEYIYKWTDQIYTGIFLFFEIIILFVLNFKYSVIKLTLPIIPYIIMLIFLAKNAPFARLHIHVVAWSVILFAFLVDWIVISAKKYSMTARILLGPSILIVFILLYLSPKLVTTINQMNTGIAFSRNEVRYLKWVGESLPTNAVVLAGGKSDLVAVAENIKKPVVYNTLWSTALLVRPNEIPGVSTSDFYIISELRNKDNFKKNKYIILEDDIYLWRDRIIGVDDGVFAASSKNLLHADDYSLKVYKFNPTLKKAIYELNLRNASVN